MGPINAIFFCIICIMSLLFHIIPIISKIKKCDLGAYSLQINCQLAHPPLRVSEHTHQSIKGSIIKHQGLFSHGGSWRNRPIGIGLADVREPSSPQFRLDPTGSEGKTSHWVKTLSAKKLPARPYTLYFMIFCAFLPKPVK